ncbi:DUF5050 domain-containing protein [Paenibacillus sp. HJGM_3]|uniref:DUF5050 domain-containing protein n=1 Tax=Paenibacillus sp. HJGM_3 TaxID=3379816 RepID=UPI003869ACA3
MKKLGIGFVAAVLLGICLWALPERSQAAERSVRVTLPDFSVNLNGNPVDNAYREYPLLVYQDITYIPMTWYDARLLGLTASWSPEGGLNIQQSPVTSVYKPNLTERRNTGAYTAVVPATAVTVNGITIDNSKEEYPLLSFRDVTYFPLTWRFAHDAFGWDYRWDTAEGLRITSQNQHLQTVGLPAYAGENDVALFHGYYYFVETTADSVNHIFRTPVQQPSNKEELYSYAANTYVGMQKQVTFQVRDGALWFRYHLGGATMGSDYFVKIGGDGKAELIHNGYLDFRATRFGTLLIQLGTAAFRGGNMFLQPDGQDVASRKPAGDPELHYDLRVSEFGTGVGGTSTATVHGDNVYMIASRDNTDANHLYRIRLKNNETQKILAANVASFTIRDDQLLYVKTDTRSLYAASLDGVGEFQLSDPDRPISWFDSVGGNVFYTTQLEDNRFALYWANPYGDDVLVWATPVAEVKAAGDRLICRLPEGGVAVLDPTGRLLLEVANPVSRILTSDDGLLLQSGTDSSIWLVQ